MSAFEALGGKGQTPKASGNPTTNAAADARRLLQAMDYRRGNKFNTPLTSRVPDASVPETRSVYELGGGAGGGASIKRVILSTPLPEQFSRTDADQEDEKPKGLRVKGSAKDVHGGVVGYIDEEIVGPDGETPVLVPPQMSLEITVVKGVDYIGVANSTKGRSQAVEDGDVPKGTYDLGAATDIEDRIFTGFYRMDFGD